MRLILDLDGVLADQVTAMARLRKMPLPAKWLAPGKWRFYDGLGIPEPWYEGVGYDFYRGMEKMPDADMIVNLILQFFSTDEICIGTSLPTRINHETGMHDFPLNRVGECVQAKLDWLRAVYPDLTNNFLVGPSKHFCAGPDTILIDDLDANISEFGLYGGTGILVPRIWNSLHPVSNDSVRRIRLRLESMVGWK